METRFERATKNIFFVACATLLPAIALLISVDTILRYFFSAPLAWTQDAVGVALFLLFCAGLPYSWYGDFHVRMDMIYVLFSQRTRTIIDSIGILAALIFGALLAYRSILSALASYRYDSSMPSGAIPLWPIQAVGAIFLFLFCVAMVESIVRRWRS